MVLGRENAPVLETEALELHPGFVCEAQKNRVLHGACASREHRVGRRILNAAREKAVFVPHLDLGTARDSLSFFGRMQGLQTVSGLLHEVAEPCARRFQTSFLRGKIHVIQPETLGNAFRPFKIVHQ